MGQYGARKQHSTLPPPPSTEAQIIRPQVIPTSKGDGDSQLRHKPQDCWTVFQVYCLSLGLKEV